MIERVDHIVLTTRDKDACIRFYSEVLGMKLEKFRTPTEERLALKFGAQKINLHEWGKEFTPRAHVAVPGSLDLCFIASTSLDEVIQRLKNDKHRDSRRPGFENRREGTDPFGLCSRSRPEPGRDFRLQQIGGWR